MSARCRPEPGAQIPTYRLPSVPSATGVLASSMFIYASVSIAELDMRLDNVLRALHSLPAQFP